jgi:hypothetical protein
MPVFISDKAKSYPEHIRNSSYFDKDIKKLTFLFT